MRSLDREEKLATASLLFRAYSILHGVLRNAPLDAVAKIPLAQLLLYVEHFTEIASALSESPRWQKTGVLEEWDYGLLDTFMDWSKYPSTAQALERGRFFPALVTLLQSSEKRPALDVCNTVLVIVHNKTIYWGQQERNFALVFQRNLRNGIMGQCFRLVTHPTLEPFVLEDYLETTRTLLRDLGTVRKMLRKGQATGDILASMVDQGPSSMHPSMYASLYNLARTAALASIKSPVDSNTSCQNCRKQYDVAKPFLACSRCNLLFQKLSAGELEETREDLQPSGS